MAQTCPHCGLISPQEAERCDCGYDFESGLVKDSYLRTTGVEVHRAENSGTAHVVAYLITISVLAVLRFDWTTWLSDDSHAWKVGTVAAIALAGICVLLWRVPLLAVAAFYALTPGGLALGTVGIVLLVTGPWQAGIGLVVVGVWLACSLVLPLPFNAAVGGVLLLGSVVIGGGKALALLVLIVVGADLSGIVVFWAEGALRQWRGTA